MEKKTQTNEILKYMREHKKGITSIQAFEKFGATRLSAIIFSLRKQGYKIECIKEKGKTRYGAKVNFARYVLKEDKQ